MPGLDEDVLVVASQEQSFICPLTRTELVEPVKKYVLVVRSLKTERC
jgi:hypothetical protein